MTFDPFEPQPFNVDIGGEREAADEMPQHAFVPPPLPYEPPEAVLIERDADLYPRRRHDFLPGEKIAAGRHDGGKLNITELG